MKHFKIKKIVTTGLSLVLGLFYLDCYMDQEHLYL